MTVNIPRAASVRRPRMQWPRVYESSRPAPRRATALRAARAGGAAPPAPPRCPCRAWPAGTAVGCSLRTAPFASQVEHVPAVEVLLLHLDPELVGEREYSPLRRPHPVRAQVDLAAVDLDRVHLAADPVAGLDHDDRCARALQLPGRAQPTEARAYYRDVDVVANRPAEPGGRRSASARRSNRRRAAAPCRSPRRRAHPHQAAGEARSAGRGHPRRPGHVRSQAG